METTKNLSNVTIRGEPVEYSPEEVLTYSADESKKIVGKIFNGYSFEHLSKKRERQSGSPHLDVMPIISVFDCLKMLPRNHPVIDAIIKETNRVLSRVPKMSALELFNSTKKDYFPKNTPICLAFDVGGFPLHDAFDNLSIAAYHVVSRHIEKPFDLPYGEPVLSAIGGMIGYIGHRNDEVFRFAEFLEYHNLGIPFVVRTYAKLGDVKRTVDSFRKALEVEHDESCLKAFGSFAGRELRRIGKSSELSDCVSIMDEDTKERVEKYFNWTTKNLEPSTLLEGKA
ncbi:hypothetical protein HY450_01740 [Candidatus Pacearchaeota archaeon]|nr:hypothetical protein [Candidatus Pacearchaeota archaeon]